MIKRHIINFIILLLFLIIISINVYSDGCNREYLKNNTIAYYKFEETNLNYTDSSNKINFYTGTTPTRTTGIIDYGQDFDGSSDRILTDHSPFLENTKLTITFWFKHDTPTHDNSIATRNITVSSRGWQILWYNGQMRAIYYTNTGGNFRSESSACNPTNFVGENSFWSFTYSSGGTIDIFHNATECSYVTHTSGTIAYRPNPYIDLGFLGNYVQGEIDEFAIFNQKLNETCLNYLYGNGTPSVIQQYPFEIPIYYKPNITSLIYPSNQSRYNNYNGSIIFNVTDIDNDIDSCYINDSSWLFVGNTSETFHFNRAITPDNNYSITIYCNDSKNLNDTMQLNFLVDTTNPTINIFSPLNNTYHNSNVLFNVSYYDLYLYRTETSIPRNDIYKDTIQLSEGILLNGNESSLDLIDSDYYNISENGGIVLNINYTGIINFTEIGITYFYEGNPAHDIFLRLWNYDTSVWDNIIQLDEGVLKSENFTAFAGTQWKYINNGLVQMQINHTSAPNPVHFLEVDEIHLNITERYYYLNDSGTLFTEWYNITEYWDISDINDGSYNVLFEATDTHTDNIFNENPEIERGLTKSGKNNYVTYKMKYGDIKFTTPLEIRLETYKQTDRLIQYFNNLLGYDLEETEIEIEADKIEYFENSNYNCHLILNEHYWYDCEGLIDAQIIEISDKKAKFKFFHTIENSISHSLGGLNYYNLSFNITIDRIAPTITNTTILNSSNSINWDFTFSENSTYGYIVGLNCSDNSIDSGSGTDNSLNVINLFLNGATTYYLNLIISDYSTNNNTYCFNATTTEFIDYGLIQSIVENAVEQEVNEMNEGMIVIVIFIVWALILAFSVYAGTKSGIVFTIIWGIFSSIWLYTETDFPKFVVVVFGAINCWIIYLLWSKD